MSKGVGAGAMTLKRLGRKLSVADDGYLASGFKTIRGKKNAVRSKLEIITDGERARQFESPVAER